MVRINIEPFHLDNLLKQHWKALVSTPYGVFKKLYSFHYSGVSYHKLQKLLITNFKEIITSQPSELQDIANKIKPEYDKIIQEVRAKEALKKNKDKAAAKFRDSILDIFNYRQFVSESTKYNAYTLSDSLGVDVCPYCNRQYTFTLNTKNGKTRPEFDHFFDKSRHPFFALSFYNLIPSCHICNSNLKGTKYFQHDTHLNPYVACFDQALRFSIDVSTADFINGVKKDYTLSLKPVMGADLDIVKKAEANAEVFKHNLLYDRHKDIVSELIQKSYYYTQSRIDELKGLSDEHGDNSLFKDEEEVKRFITGVYTESADLGRRPMSKLISDISVELGLIK